MCRPTEIRNGFRIDALRLSIPTYFLHGPTGPLVLFPSFGGLPQPKLPPWPGFDDLGVLDGDAANPLFPGASRAPQFHTRRGTMPGGTALALARDQIARTRTW